MGAPPSGITDAEWLSWPTEARALILAQRQEIQALCAQLTATAIELASLREQIGRTSPNSSKPALSNGPGFKPPERRKGSGRKRGGQPGPPGSGPELLPIERVDEVVEHHRDSCRRSGTLLRGENPEPLPLDVETSCYRPKLIGQVGLLTGSFPLSFSKVQLLLNQLLGVATPADKTSSTVAGHFQASASVSAPRW
jgi:hypothetical protein